MVVAVDSNTPAYSRDLFKTWDISKKALNTFIDIVLLANFTAPHHTSFWNMRYTRKWAFKAYAVIFSLGSNGSCLLKPAVLKRDGTDVVTSSACAATSGNWVSPYDGVPTTLASDLDIVGPLWGFASLMILIILQGSPCSTQGGASKPLSNI